MNGARGCLTAILILVSFVLLIFWLGGWVGFTYEWNTKLTLTINTPDGERSGSTVRYSYSSPGCLHGYCMDEEGEAVVVHLDNDRYLFALDGLTWSLITTTKRLYKDNIIAAGANKNDPFRTHKSWARHMNKLVGLPAKTEQRRYYPVIVMFEDINDPTTLKLVDPDDLDWTLGCSIPTDEAKPWRAEGLTWREWMKWHFILDTMRDVGAEFEMSEEQTKAFMNYELKKRLPSIFSRLGAKYGFSDEYLNILISRDIGPRGASYHWIKNYRKKYLELLASSRDTSADCYSIKVFNLEVVDEPKTEGRVEAVLVRLRDLRTSFLYALQDAPEYETFPDVLKAITPSHFNTEIWK